MVAELVNDGPGDDCARRRALSLTAKAATWVNRPMRLIVLIATCAGVSGVALAAAGAAGAPNVTVSITAPSSTSRLVHIVNHGTVRYGHFIVQAIGTPRIIAASRPCSVEKDLGFSGTKSTWRYRAACRRDIGRGQAFDVRLTTTGMGRLAVYVVVNGALVEIVQ
jgi:hypothetical protein